MEAELTKKEKMRIYQQKWREDNADRRHDYGVKYYNENKDKFVAYQLAHKDEIRQRCKENYQKKKQEKLNLKIKELLK